jgi:hypothetical protein
MRIRIIAVVILLTTQAASARAGVNLNVNIGAPPAVVVAPPPAPVPPPPLPPQPQVMIESRPDFIFSPSLGFYVSVGIPYDIVYLNQNYYLYSSGAWYVAPSCQGPWVATQRRLPPGLRRFRYDQIRHYRDREYALYQRDRDHYRGRWHRPEGEWRKERRDGHREEHHGEHRENHR